MSNEKEQLNFTRRSGHCQEETMAVLSKVETFSHPFPSEVCVDHLLDSSESCSVVVPGVTRRGGVKRLQVSGCDRGTPNLHGSHPFVTAGRWIKFVFLFCITRQPFDVPI